MAFYNYNPKEVSIVVGGVDIRGYGDGDFVSISFDEDGFTTVSGADGDISRSLNPSTLATVTITLLGGSPSNDVLSGLHIVDRSTGLGTFPLFVKDNSGRSLFISDAAWVTKFADLTKGKEASTVEWTIQAANSQMFVGGN